MALDVSLERRRLGGLTVPVVGLGGNNFGRRLDLAGTRAVVDAALAAGVDFLDTADIYGSDAGASESLLGEALEGRWDQVTIATKFGMDMTERGAQGVPDVSRGSREYVRWAVEGSLRRLRTDVIDLYQYHEPDGVTPIADTLGAMSELVDEGKVRWLGVSNVDADELREARETVGERLVSVQNEYSLLTRDIEQEVAPEAEQLGVGIIPFFPLASGLLTGKYTRGEEATEGRLAGREIPEQRWDRAEALQSYADERGISLLEVAVGGLLAMPAMSSVIAGATKPEQVRANVAAGAWEPTSQDVEALRALR